MCRDYLACASETPLFVCEFCSEENLYWVRMHYDPEFLLVSFVDGEVDRIARALDRRAITGRPEQERRTARPPRAPHSTADRPRSTGRTN